MKGKIKMLGLTLLVAVALGAVEAQGAQATTHDFELTDNAQSADLTGVSTSTHVFTVGGGEPVACASAAFAGMLEENTAEEIRLTPEYGECEWAGIEAEVTNSGCTFVLHSTTTQDPVTPNESATVDIDCNHEGSITINIGGGLCVIHISDTHPGKEGTVNQELHGITYEKLGQAPHEELKINAHVHGLAYIATGELCFLGGIEAGTGTNATLEGALRVAAYETGSEHITEHQIGLNLTTTP